MSKLKVIKHITYDNEQYAMVPELVDGCKGCALIFAKGNGDYSCPIENGPECKKHDAIMIADNTESYAEYVAMQVKLRMGVSDAEKET